MSQKLESALALIHLQTIVNSITFKSIVQIKKNANLYIAHYLKYNLRQDNISNNTRVVTS